MSWYIVHVHAAKTLISGRAQGIRVQNGRSHKLPTILALRQLRTAGGHLVKTGRHLVGRDFAICLFVC